MDSGEHGTEDIFTEQNRVDICPQITALLAVCFTTALAFIANSMTRSLVSLYAADMGANKALVGVIVSAFSFVPIFLTIPVGRLTVRLGFRNLIILGLVGMGISGLVVGLLDGISMLVLGEVVLGVAQFCVIVGSQSFTGSLGKRGNRESSFSWYSTSTSAGLLIGPLIGGGLADRFGFQPPFLAAGILAIISGVVAYVTLPKGVLTDKKDPHDFQVDIKGLFKNPGVKVGMVTSFGLLFSMGIRRVAFPLYMNSLGYSTFSINALGSIQSCSSLLVRPFLASVTRLMGGRSMTMTISILLCAVGIGITPFITSYAPLIMGAILLGVGTGFCTPLSMVTVADSISDEERPMGMSLRLTGNRFAQFVSPLLFGSVSQIAGMAVGFLSSSMILFFTAVLLRRWYQHLEGKFSRGQGFFV